MAAKKNSSVTEYVVLRKTQSGTWEEVEQNNVLAGSSLAAIREVAGDEPKGEFHAVPARSWEASHVRLKSRTETVVKVTVEPLGERPEPAKEEEPAAEPVPEPKGEPVPGPS
jgi:hypothetical protein